MEFMKVNIQTSGDLSVDSFCGKISEEDYSFMNINVVMCYLDIRDF
jgi:hypothetical protein